MRTVLLFGGPLIATIGFSFYSGLLDFVEKHPGLENEAGVEMGGTFKMEYRETYRCDEGGNNCVLVDESTEFSEVDGLALEQEPIEYREGDEITTVRKQSGIAKYGNIVMRRPTGFNWKTFTFAFDGTCHECGEHTDGGVQLYGANELQLEGGKEMYQIDPPTLVIPAR